MSLFEQGVVPVPATMRALVQVVAGALPVLVERPVPRPGPGQVLVRMAASPINPSDIMALEGTYGTAKTLPVVPGLEGSGTVVAAGPGLLGQFLLGWRVTTGAPGDGDGTWAEYMLAPVQHCIPLLPSVSLEQGAMLFVNPMTAWMLMERARRSQHRAVVSTAAASAVGQMILRLGQRYRIPVIHVVRREGQVALLRRQGASHVLNSSNPDFAGQLRGICQSLGATLALDAVAGEMTGLLLGAMPRGGRVVVYGKLSGAPGRVDADQLIFGDKRVEGFWLAKTVAQSNPLGLVFRAFALQRALADDLRTTVRARVGLADVGQALVAYKGDMGLGKILIMPGLG